MSNAFSSSGTTAFALPLSLAVSLSACTMTTPGSQAPAKGQADCVTAAARYFKVPAESFQVTGSGLSTSATLYQVDLLHAPSGRRAKCNVDQNGTVNGVVEVR